LLDRASVIARHLLADERDEQPRESRPSPLRNNKCPVTQGLDLDWHMHCSIPIIEGVRDFKRRTPIVQACRLQDRWSDYSNSHHIDRR
jgi:hypothetical protein